ncbi:universal stress protein [Halonotius pteroides]|jgi:nucleotide-binding universal stress UspA family protein|uniref:Universal stress protein n=1 Tax=Halonotius pteroides TaxID=268735 RepID=A0A3A6QD39_9EURY|nr:universal stress protein [Halonotius pteroides]RJX50823.1 universal stress protein [Halonotius pteroides]
MYETVLFPTDGSEAASEAASHAIDLADKHDAAMHILYVVDHERVSQMAPKLGSDHIKGTLQEEGERITDAVADAASSAGLDTVVSIREGAPGETITEYADDIDADTIVMGTNGRTGMDRLLMGSVAERVIQNTELPVMTVKRADD